IYLFVGWLTVVVSAGKNFNQPTWEFGRSDPSSIMLPRLISSQHLYATGFLIYLTSMSALYLGASFAGPAIVMPIASVVASLPSGAGQLAGGRGAESDHGEARDLGANVPAASGEVASAESSGSEKGPSAQWPLMVALAMIGLLPNISGLREPELFLRRLSHRFAFIPDYIRYIAYRMQESNFDYTQFVGFDYK